MGSIVISKSQEEALLKLKKYAEANKLSFADKVDVLTKRKKDVSDRKEHTVLIPLSYKVVYCVEAGSELDEKVGKFYRHLSMSIAKQNKYPNPAVVGMIAAKLGFSVIDGNGNIVEDRNRTDISMFPSKNCMVWQENNAVNVMEELLVDVE